MYSDGPWQVEDGSLSLGEGEVFVDCPGFLDNRGFELSVANAVNVRQTLHAASRARVVVIINFHSILADRGRGVADLFSMLSGLFGSVEGVRRHAKSIVLAISKAPLTHPETERPTTLQQLKRKLMDGSGLEPQAEVKQSETTPEVKPSQSETVLKVMLSLRAKRLKSEPFFSLRRPEPLTQG